MDGSMESYTNEGSSLGPVLFVGLSTEVGDSQHSTLLIEDLSRHRGCSWPADQWVGRSIRAGDAASQLGRR